MKYIGNLIAIAIVVFLIVSVINFKKTDTYQELKARSSQPIQVLKQGVEVFKHNLGFTFSPQRERDVTMVQKETQLIELAPDIFGGFGQKDWKDFWNVIYEPIKEKQGLYEVKRYRSKAEIRSYFVGNYYSGFSNLNQNQWKYFWEIVLSK